MMSSLRIIFNILYDASSLCRFFARNVDKTCPTNTAASPCNSPDSGIAGKMR